jgi:hypothetical protein
VVNYGWGPAYAKCSSCPQTVGLVVKRDLDGRVVRVVVAGVLASLILFAGLATAQPAPEPHQIHLRYRYGGETPDRKPVGLQISIGAISDARNAKDPAQIGEAQVTGTEAIPVVSVSPLTGFVDEALRTTMGKWKVDVSPEAAHVLRVEILRFWILEKKRVAAEVRFRFFLEDRAGAILWQGEAADDDSTWGKTYNEALYIDAASHATERAIADLFNTKTFRDSLTPGKSHG